MVFPDGFGLAYGERALRVSEGYGFLFVRIVLTNTITLETRESDNENSIEGSVSVGYKTQKWSAKMSLPISYFQLYCWKTRRDFGTNDHRCQRRENLHGFGLCHDFQR